MPNKLALKTKISFGIIILLIPIIIFLSLQIGVRKYYFISVVVMLLALISFCLAFENRKPKAHEIITIAVMCAIAVVGRAAFIAIPFFKPVAAIVIITGVTLGAQSGFLCGAISMLVSNFIIGQGAWTPWQMVAFGIIGFISGAIFYKNPNRQKPKYIAIYGAISFFIIVGPILDLSTVFMASQIPDITAIMAIFLAGIPVNLVQAIATLIFLLVLTKPMLEKLNRIKIKYGMME